MCACGAGNKNFGGLIRGKQGHLGTYLGPSSRTAVGHHPSPAYPQQEYRPAKDDADGPRNPLADSIVFRPFPCQANGD